MKKIRYVLIVMWMLACSVMSAEAQISIGIGLPNVSIGINLPLFPELVPVPGYPVYYAPGLDANYFFYDGMYWVYQNDNWYASSWYNGPWGVVEPYYVPLYILRVPVRYYRQPPVYFRGWHSNAPPRWGQHWGHSWEQRRRGWDRWNRGSAPSRAPLPVYQRQYSGDRYPRQLEQQRSLRSQSYRYQPRDKVIQQHFKQQAAPPAQRGRQEAPPARSPGQNDQRQQREQQQNQQNDQRQQREQQQNQQNDQRQQREQQLKQQNDQRQQQQKQQNDQRQQQQKQQNDQRQQREQQLKQQNDQRQQQAPRVHEREQKPQDRGESQEPNQGRGKGQDRDDERGRGRDK